MRNKYTYVKIFRNPQVLEEMLALKKAGNSTSLLSRRYLCTRAAIMYRCKIANGEIVLKPRKKKGEKDYPYKSTMEETNPNKGRKYREYIRIDKEKYDELIEIILMKDE